MSISKVIACDDRKVDVLEEMKVHKYQIKVNYRTDVIKNKDNNYLNMMDNR